jgi:hypothetical protein
MAKELEERSDETPQGIKFFSAFLGIQTILEKSYLLFVEEVVHVCSIERNDIFEVSKLKFVPIQVKTRRGDFI